MSEVTKIVISISRNEQTNHAVIGIQRTGCDAIFASLDGDLSTIIAQLSTLVHNAEEKWQQNPRYPTTNIPAPTPSPAPVQTTPVNTQRTRTQSTNDRQLSFI